MSSALFTLRLVKFIVVFFVLLWAFWFLTASTYACSEVNVRSTDLVSASGQQSTCPGGSLMTNQPRPGTRDCRGNLLQSGAPVYDALITFHYSDGSPDCTSTVFFLDPQYYQNRSFCSGTTTLYGQAEYISCASGTCNPALERDNPQTYTYTGSCDTASNSYCTGGIPNSCPRGATGTSPGVYCQGWACGWDCNASTSYQCTRHYDSLSGAEYPYSSGGGSGYNLCAADCTAPLGPPACTMLVNGSTSANIANGSSANLTWSCTNNPTSCTASGAWSGGKSDSGSQDTGALSGPNTYDYTITCSNSGGTSDPATATVNVADGSGGFSGGSPPTPAPTCSVTAWSDGQTRGAASVNAVSGRNKVNWFINDNSAGTNSGGDASFSGLSPNTNYTVTATWWDDTYTNSSVDCVADTFRTGQPTTPPPGGGGGGGGRPPTPPPQPLPSAAHDVRIRFWNADGATPYSGTDVIKLIINHREGNRNVYSNAQHNDNCYGNNCTSSHGGISDGVCCGDWGCPEWHPYKDPGHQVTTDGTITGCPSNNIDVRSSRELTCSPSDDSELCDGSDHGCSVYESGTRVGSCCGRQSWPYWGECRFSGNDSCVGYDYMTSGNTYPRCMTAEQRDEGPYTVTSSNPQVRIQWEGTRGDLDPIVHSFTMAGPPGMRIQVRSIHHSNYSGSWQWVINPALYPNRGAIVKDYGQITSTGATANYFASEWFGVTSNEGVGVFDVFIEGNERTVSGNIFLDTNGNGQKEAAEAGYGGGRVYYLSSFVTSDANGNYTIPGLVSGQNYTFDLDVPSGYRVTTANDPTTINNLNRDRTINFGITPLANSWFQTRDADLFSQGSLISRIPLQCQVSTGCDEYLSLVGGGGFPGVPVYNSSSAPSFGFGSVSSLGWMANSAISPTGHNYSYFVNRMPSGAYQVSESTITNSGYFSSNGTVDSRGYKWFKREGDLTLDANFNLNNAKAVLFVNGNVTIKQRLTINGGGAGTGFFALIASGNITIDPDVTYQAQPAPRNGSRPALEGIFLADGQVRTGTLNPSNDSQLYVRGVLVGFQSVALERNLDRNQTGGGNDTTPSEFVEYAPDLILNLPPELLRDNPIWEEVAP